MKKIMVLLVIAVLLSFSVSAHHKSKKDLNSECQAFGFKFGVVEWKWEKKQWWEWGKKEWNPDEDSWDTSVTGTHNAADWNVGTLDDFGITGIAVKSGKDHYVVNGASGTVTDDKNIEHITFCFTPQCVQSSQPVCGNLICEGENVKNCPIDCTGGG